MRQYLLFSIILFLITTSLSAQQQKVKHTYIVRAITKFGVIKGNLTTILDSGIVISGNKKYNLSFLDIKKIRCRRRGTIGLTTLATVTASLFIVNAIVESNNIGTSGLSSAVRAFSFSTGIEAGIITGLIAGHFIRKMDFINYDYNNFIEFKNSVTK